MDPAKLFMKGVATGTKDALWGIKAVLDMDKEATIKSLSEMPGMRDSSPSPARRQIRPSRLHSSKPEAKILHRIFQCCALNGGACWLSLLAFNNIILPCLHSGVELLFGSSSGVGRTLWSWLKPILSYTFGALWVLPLFLISRVVNSLWFQDIANSAYWHLRGRPQQLPSISKFIADILFNILIQALFLIQSLLVTLLPVSGLGQLVSLLHLSLLYSLYAFEYKWFNMGWELHQRLHFIENNWAYFLGFGLPLATATSFFSSYIVSGCVFAILFPLFIISGNEAVPLTGTCAYPLQLFSPVVYLSNAIFHRTFQPIQSRQSLGPQRIPSKSAMPAMPFNLKRTKTPPIGKERISRHR